MILTVSRILRCNPWNPGGWDPVPEQGLRYKGSRIIPSPDSSCDAHEDCIDCREDDGNNESIASYKEDGE